MSPTDDTAIVAIRNILTRLCKRSGLSPDRLATTEIDISPLLDLPVIRRHAATHGTTRTAAVLPVVRDHARRLPATHRVITDAELSLGLLRETETAGIDPDDLYSQDLGDRRKYLSAHWSRLHEIADAEAIPPAPTVRSLRATPERRAFTALAALLVTGNVYTDARSPLGATRHGAPGRIGTLTVVGDAVIDHIYRVDAIPDARGFARGRFSDNPGGKGLDRAVAAARLGIDVRLISAVGDDEAGRLALGRTYAQLAAGLDRIEADAIAIRDWPEILYAEDFKGTWGALGELSDRAVPIAPEGDVMGAATALVARAFDPASLPFLTDISGLDRAKNRLVLWHYGVSPRLADGPRSLDPALKQETFPLKAGPMTLIRLSLRDDGTLRIFVCEGEIEAEKSRANRAAGYFRPADAGAEELVRHFIDEGYEHHVTAVYGRWADAVLHLGRQLGVQVDHV